MILIANIVAVLALAVLVALAVRGHRSPPKDRGRRKP